jgi:hypothetical protein
MDYLYFLRDRTRFIRAFYDEAAAGFIERKRKIEAGEEPFAPSYSFEADEPAFLDEWCEADESLDVLGQMCISFLAGSLQLYLKEALADRRVVPSEDTKAAFKQGWINGYRAVFRGQLGIDWTTGPSNLAILEEMVLARHRAQHPESITTLRVAQSAKDAIKYPRGFFADEFELAAATRRDPPLTDDVRPLRLNVTREKLCTAIDEVERLCDWLNGQ